MSTADITPAELAEIEASEMVSIDEDLILEVLDPYQYKNSRYLLDAQYRATENSVLAYGNFSIDESSYIRSTGHFNAAEFLICFNQLAYSAFAPAIVNEQIPVLVGWSIEDYFDYQLPSMLIKTAATRFRRPINAQRFHARLICEDFEIMHRSVRYLKIPCSIEFWDADGGSASGQIELAALNIP